MKVYNLPHDLTPGSSLAPDDVVISGYASRQSTVRNKIILHHHMLNLLIDGRKTIAQAAGTVTVYHDEILLLAAGNCLTSEVLSDAGQFRSIILYFSSHVLEDFQVRHAALIGRLSGPAPRKEPVVTFAKDAFIRNYIESLSLLLAAPGLLTPEIRRLKLEELLLYLVQTAPAGLDSFRAGPADAAPELVLRKVVETHVARPVTVEELAFLAHMSLSTFQRRFVGIYGLPPQKWLLKQRMQLAADLLLHHHQPPSNVYQQVGYESHSSFSEAFRKTFGLSPTAFRQQQRPAVPEPAARAD